MVLENRRKDRDADEKGTRPVVKKCSGGGRPSFDHGHGVGAVADSGHGSGGPDVPDTGGEPRLVSAALRAGAGNLPLEDDPMNGLEGWQRLILRQSPAHGV